MAVVWEYNAPAKSGKPKFTWSVTEEGLITVAWRSAVRSGGHADLLSISEGLLAQESFCVVHVLYTYLFAFSLSSLPAFCYRICFDMEVVSPVIHKTQNYSCNYLDIRLQNVTADFLQKLLFWSARHTEKDLLVEVLMAALSLSFIHSLTSYMKNSVQLKMNRRDFLSLLFLNPNGRADVCCIWFVLEEHIT